MIRADTEGAQRALEWAILSAAVLEAVAPIDLVHWDRAADVLRLRFPAADIGAARQAIVDAYLADEYATAGVEPSTLHMAAGLLTFALDEPPTPSAVVLAARIVEVAATASHDDQARFADVLVGTYRATPTLTDDVRRRCALREVRAAILPHLNDGPDDAAMRALAIVDAVDQQLCGGAA